MSAEETPVVLDERYTLKKFEGEGENRRLVEQYDIHYEGGGKDPKGVTRRRFDATGKVIQTRTLKGVAIPRDVAERLDQVRNNGTH